jgi:indole-3-glycerol phosphate synthase
VNGFLQRMEASSRARARATATREPLAALRRRALDTEAPLPLRNRHAFELIAEYKRRSPARGRLAGGDDARLQRIEAYARGGAAAVSVLTEPTQFEGAKGISRNVRRRAPQSPAMRKDFLGIAPVYEARAAGGGCS